MAYFNRYLYNDFTFDIDTGIVPLIVDAEVIKAKQSVPRVTWNINFGRVSYELKNSIESSIILNSNDLAFSPAVGPAFFIGKHENVIDGVITYYLTYLFEYDYHDYFVNKPIDYEVVDNYHVLDGGFKILISHSLTDQPIKLKNNTNPRRKLYSLNSKIKLNHKVNNTFELKLPFIEQASKLAVQGAFIVGVPDVDYLTSC